MPHRRTRHPEGWPERRQALLMRKRTRRPAARRRWPSRSRRLTTLPDREISPPPAASRRRGQRPVAGDLPRLTRLQPRLTAEIGSPGILARHHRGGRGHAFPASRRRCANDGICSLIACGSIEMPFSQACACSGEPISQLSRACLTSPHAAPPSSQSAAACGVLHAVMSRGRLPLQRILPITVRQTPVQ